MDAQEHYERNAQYLRAIFDAVPLPAFIVDGDVRIHDFNTAAEDFLGTEPAAALYRRVGEAFHCTHAEVNGCGKAEPCLHCLIRNGVHDALEGRSTHRALHRATVRTAEGTRSLDLLVSASLLPYTEEPRAVVILEDLNQVLPARKQPGHRQPRRGAGRKSLAHAAT